MNCTGQCEGCAYKAGAAANLEPENHMKGLLVAMASNPFFCHESLAWKVDARRATIVRNRGPEMRRELLAITLPGRAPKVCSGWKHAVAHLASRGWYRGDVARVRRKLARMALASLIEVEMNTGDGRRRTSIRKRAMAALENLMGVLVEDLKQLNVDPREIGL